MVFYRHQILFYFICLAMAENSLLKEILDTLSDPDTVKFFAAVHGLVGNSEVEHRLKELEWNEHIENLWQEVLPAIQPSLKRLQDSLDDDDDKPSTSGYDVLSTSEPPRKKQRKEVLSSPQSPSTDDNRQYGGGGLGSESEDESEKPYYI